MQLSVEAMFLELYGPKAENVEEVRSDWFTSGGVGRYAAIKSNGTRKAYTRYLLTDR